MRKSGAALDFGGTFTAGSASALLVLLVPISVSGSAAGLARPPRRADQSRALGRDGGAAASAVAVLASATAALAGSYQPIGVGFPESEGWPVMVTARERAAGRRGGRAAVPQRSTSIRRPGDVLDMVDFRVLADRFPASLPREPDDPAIFRPRRSSDGSASAMLILSLTGIWLWWPRNGGFLRGPALASRGADLDQSASSARLLDFDSAGGGVADRHLSRFPQTARAVMSSIAPMNPQAQRPGPARLRARRA